MDFTVVHTPIGGKPPTLCCISASGALLPASMWPKHGSCPEGALAWRCLNNSR